MYTALILDQNSRSQLLAHFQGLLPSHIEKVAHHMTINLNGPEKGPLVGSNFKVGDTAELTVVSYAYDDKVMAAGVETEVPSANPIKHITLGVDRAAGGKPAFSNKLTNWAPTSPIKLTGTIQVVS